MRRNASKLVSIFSLLGVEESRVTICRAFEKTSSGGLSFDSHGVFSSVLLL